MTDEARMVDATNAPIRYPSPPYAITFAALGLLGGALTGSLTPEKGWEPIFAAITMINSALLGFWLTTKRQGDGRIGPGRIVFGTLLAGAFNGLLLVAMMMPIGALLGVPIGAIFALPFVFAFLLVAACTSGVGRTRAGSLVDRMHRRRHFAGAACLAGVMATFLFVHQPRLTTLRFVCAIVSSLVAITIVVCDARDWRTARSAVRVAAGTPIVDDFGLGPDVVIPTPSEAPYRLTERFITLRRGDAALARPLLVEGLATSAILATITVVVGVLAWIGPG